jgi:hypothetical protein
MAETKAKLADEVAALRAENARLRDELDVARGPAAPVRPAPQEPSFGMSEGMRAELEMTGSTTSPWTGKVYKGDGDGEPVEAADAVEPVDE